MVLVVVMVVVGALGSHLIVCCLCLVCYVLACAMSDEGSRDLIEDGTDPSHDAEMPPKTLPAIMQLLKGYESEAESENDDPVDDGASDAEGQEDTKQNIQ